MLLKLILYKTFINLFSQKFAETWPYTWGFIYWKYLHRNIPAVYWTWQNFFPIKDHKVACEACNKHTRKTRKAAVENVWSSIEMSITWKFKQFTKQSKLGGRKGGVVFSSPISLHWKRNEVHGSFNNMTVCCWRNFHRQFRSL